MFNQRGDAVLSRNYHNIHTEKLGISVVTIALKCWWPTYYVLVVIYSGFISGSMIFTIAVSKTFPSRQNINGVCSSRKLDRRRK